MARTFTASRWAGGAFFFPAKIELAPGGVRYTKRGMIGSNEELIHFTHIASVRLSRGLLYTTLSIETSGGSAPIVITGLRPSDAKEIRDAIEAAQAGE
jgi:Bacterial PH domain